MVDIHTHILPYMDDGASDIEESLALIQMLKHQGIFSIVLTPHFYSHQERLSDFLERRQISYENLKGAVADFAQESGLPQDGKSDLEICSDDQPEFEMLLGSETYLSETLFAYDSISQLCTQGTNYLLLELPYAEKWGPSVFKQIDRLAAKFGVIPIIAHAERYEASQHNTEKIFQELVDLGCLLQFNAHSVVDRVSRHSTLKLIKNGWIDFIGSDCHNMKGRPPEFDLYNEIVKKKLGEVRYAQLGIEHNSSQKQNL